ncbi:MAG TPA: YdcH family protein [Candidatus Deferrimicrobiaceae bacterium]|nr:YdcH family protein [Candidatus Deferrimicrobiaceae bacterium]
MPQAQDAKMAALIERNPEFRNLVHEHRMLDDQLKELDRKVYLTPDEEMERKRLQKLKLAKKDQIAKMLTS